MTQDFWWFALVGFMIGFVLSTLWEWLHFRGKRMRIQNRRIAELEAALRAAQAQINSAPPVAPHPWPAADFQDSAVYLETEEGTAAPAVATQLPAATTPRRRVLYPSSPQRLPAPPTRARRYRPARPCHPRCRPGPRHSSGRPGYRGGRQGFDRRC